MRLILGNRLQLDLDLFFGGAAILILRKNRVGHLKFVRRGALGILLPLGRLRIVLLLLQHLLIIIFLREVKRTRTVALLVRTVASVSAMGPIALMFFSFFILFFVFVLFFAFVRGPRATARSQFGFVQ